MTLPQSRGWDQALVKLRRTIPGASELLPDKLANAARSCGKRVEWKPVPGFGDDSDAEVWAALEPQMLSAPDDEVTVIPDVCFRDGLDPLVVRRIDLESWIESFIDRYGDELFGGDVIFIFPSSVLLVHHEGFAAEISSTP